LRAAAVFILARVEIIEERRGAAKKRKLKVGKQDQETFFPK